jgi:hypothetical protein
VLHSLNSQDDVYIRTDGATRTQNNYQRCNPHLVENIIDTHENISYTAAIKKGSSYKETFLPAVAGIDMRS